MADSPPHRFRFSLGFLLAWVLLTGALTLISLNITEKQYGEFTYVDGINSASYAIVMVEKGWPCHVVTRVVRPSEESLVTAPEKFRSQFHAAFKAEEFHLAGLAGNLAICIVIGFIVCKLFPVVLKKVI